MSLIASDLSSDLYNFFKSMGGGMSNSKFAKDFSDIINDWYMDNSDGTTIDAGKALVCGRRAVAALQFSAYFLACHRAFGNHLGDGDRADCVFLAVL